MRFASPSRRLSLGYLSRLMAFPLWVIHRYCIARRAVIVVLVTLAGMLLSTGAYRIQESEVLFLGPNGASLFKALLFLVAGYAFIRSMLLPKSKVHLCLRWICAALLFYGSTSFIAVQLSTLGVIEGFNQELAVRFLLLASMVVMFTIGVFRPALWLSVERPRVLGGLMVAVALLGVVLWLAAATNPTTNTLSGGLIPIHEVNIRNMPGWYLAGHGVLVLVSLTTLAAAVTSRSLALSGDLFVAVAGFFATAVVYTALVPAGSGRELTAGSVLLLCATVLASVAVNWEVRFARSRKSSERLESSSVPDNVVARAASRSDFSRLLIHELNAPIWAVQRFANVISQSELNEQQTRAVLGIMNEVERLATIATDINALAKFDRPMLSVRLEPNPLSAIIDDVRLFAASISPDHNVFVSSSPDVFVRVDRDRIGQVLRNLLLNAAKYSPRGSRIKVEAEIWGNRVSLSVVDEGIGITQSEADRIFEPFSRGKMAENSTITGDGIGLYLSKSIVESHGSSLRVTSGTGAGAAFSFDLEVHDVEGTAGR